MIKTVKNGNNTVRLKVVEKSISCENNRDSEGIQSYVLQWLEVSQQINWPNDKVVVVVVVVMSKCY